MNAKHRLLLQALALVCTPAAPLLPPSSYASPLYSVTVLPNVWANGLSANGEVTGYTPPYGVSSEAFIYTNGTTQILGTLGGTSSDGQGIDSSGQVTGESNINESPTGTFHAFGRTRTRLSC